MAMKLVVLQQLLKAGEQRPQGREVATEDLWKVAKTGAGTYLEYEPTTFRRRLTEYMTLRLREHDKKVYNWRGRIKRIDQTYTEEQIIDAFKKAWNDITREIKRETIKVI